VEGRFTEQPESHMDNRMFMQATDWTGVRHKMGMQNTSGREKSKGKGLFNILSHQ